MFGKNDFTRAKQASVRPLMLLQVERGGFKEFEPGWNFVFGTWTLPLLEYCECESDQQPA